MHVRKITKMRTLSLILLAGLTMLLLGCGLSTPTQINEPTPEIGETTTTAALHVIVVRHSLKRSTAA